MKVDFASMNVGDTQELKAGEWDGNRETFDACSAYVRSVNPHPQFEFFQVAAPRAGAAVRWYIRRTR